MNRLLENLQKLGRALMLPIAVLPVAGLLLRLGQPDLLDVPMMAAAGNAVFANLGLLFAAGIGIGLARGNHGAAGVAAIVGYLVTTEGAAALLQAPPASVLLDASADVLAAWPDGAMTIAIEAWKSGSSESCRCRPASSPESSPAGCTTATATSGCRTTWRSSADAASSRS